MKYYLITQSEFIQGDLVGEGCRPYHLPGFECSKCNNTWFGMRRLNYTCPDDLNIKILQWAHKPRNNQDWNNIRKYVVAKLSQYGCEDAMPGDGYSPFVFGSLPANESMLFTDNGMSFFADETIHDKLLSFRGAVLNKAYHHERFFIDSYLFKNTSQITEDIYYQEKRKMKATRYCELGSSNSVNNINVEEDESTRCSACGYRNVIVKKKGVGVDKDALRDFEISCLHNGGKMIISQDVKRYFESIKCLNVSIK